MPFIIYPAIDLRRGQVVRLRQGDPAAQTTYGDDPAMMARRWAAEGTAWLHVVNLDGALARSAEESPLSIIGQDSSLPVVAQNDTDGGGLSLNLRRLMEIRAAVALPIQFGGGLRTLDDIALGLELGATRVVLGTVAVRQPELVEEAVARFGADRIVVGIDARDGLVATHGWRETSALTALTVARRMADLGVPRIVYTDITRDGTLTGVNLAATAALARESGLKVIASGGVASLADIRALAARQADGIEGVIVGQALYTGAIDLKGVDSELAMTTFSGAS
jgi:phosphoribosylformimino-5-aminoimidazole carboxamide ribotide isomerase